MNSGKNQDYLSIIISFHQNSIVAIKKNEL